MSKYDTVVRQTEELANSSQTTLQISKKNKKNIDIDEIIELFHGLEKQGKAKGLHTEFMIRGESVAGWSTLKGFGDDLKTVEDFLDYYNNTVSVTTKFGNFFQLQLTVFTSAIKNNKVVYRNDVKHEKVKHPDGKIDKKVNPKVFGKKKTKN